MSIFFFSHSGADRDDGDELKIFFKKLVLKIRSENTGEIAKGAADNEIAYRDWTSEDFGKDYVKVIAPALATCNCFVAALSPTFFLPDSVCPREVRAFLERTETSYLDTSPRVVPFIWKSPERFKDKLEASVLNRAFRNLEVHPTYLKEGIRPLLLDQNRKDILDDVLTTLARSILDSVSKESPKIQLGDSTRIAKLLIGEEDVDSKPLDYEQKSYARRSVDGDLAWQVRDALEGFEPSPADDKRAAAILLDQMGLRTGEGEGFTAVVKRLSELTPITHQLQRFIREFQGFEDAGETKARLETLRSKWEVANGSPAPIQKAKLDRNKILIAVEQRIGGAKSYEIKAFLGDEMVPFTPQQERLFNAEDLCDKFNELVLDVLAARPDSELGRTVSLEVMFPTELLLSGDLDAFKITDGNTCVDLGTRHPILLKCWDRIWKKEYKAYPRGRWIEKTGHLKGLSSIARDTTWLVLDPIEPPLTDQMEASSIVGSPKLVNDSNILLDLLSGIMTMGVPMAVWPCAELTELEMKKVKGFLRGPAEDVPQKLFELRQGSPKKRWPVTVLLDFQDRVPPELLPNKSEPRQ